MTQRFDLLAPRKGTDGKTYFTKIGVAFPLKTQEGFSIQMEALPLPTLEDGVLRTTMIMMPPRDKEQQDVLPSPPPKRRPVAQNTAEELDDVIPF